MVSKREWFVSVDFFFFLQKVLFHKAYALYTNQEKTKSLQIEIQMLFSQLDAK